MLQSILRHSQQLFATIESSSSNENESNQNDLMTINPINRFAILCVSYMIRKTDGIPQKLRHRCDHFFEYSRPRNVLKIGKSYLNYYLELPIYLMYIYLYVYEIILKLFIKIYTLLHCILTVATYYLAIKMQALFARNKQLWE